MIAEQALLLVPDPVSFQNIPPARGARHHERHGRRVSMVGGGWRAGGSSCSTGAIASSPAAASSDCPLLHGLTQELREVAPGDEWAQLTPHPPPVHLTDPPDDVEADAVLDVSFAKPLSVRLSRVSC
jgi:hypothetical protein